MSDTFITEYYFWVAIPMQIILFISVYVSSKNSHGYMDNQAGALVASVVWPFTFAIVLCAIAVCAAFGLITLVGLGTTWIADKTIGKLMREQSK